MESGPDRNDGIDGDLFFYASQPSSDVHHDRHDPGIMRGGVYLGGEVTLARLDCRQKHENGPETDSNTREEEQDGVSIIDGLSEPDNSAEPNDPDVTGGEDGYVGSDPDAGGEAEEEAMPGGLIYLGVWTVTAYCSCPICCGEYSTGYTASGTQATAGRTAASNALPIGTEVMVGGNTYIIEDTGWTPYGETWIDIYFDSHEEALAWGVQEMEVYTR